MQTVSMTLDLTLDEAQDLLSRLWELRNPGGVDPAYYAESHTIDGVKTAIVGNPQAVESYYGQSVFPTNVEAPAPLTVPVTSLLGPNYQPPQAPLAAQPQPAPGPTWQPPQAPLAAQPQPAMPVQWQQQPAAPIPTAAPAYTLDQLATAAAPLMDAGRGAELTAMLSLFGVASLNQIPPERFPDVALNLRAMGATI